MTNQQLIDKLCKEHGESLRKLFTSALEFLDENESKWGLDEQINREQYCLILLEKKV
jgi:hypothetical protein